MLQHVGGVNGVNAMGAEWKTISDVEPQIYFAKRIGVNIYKAGKIIGAAAKVQVQSVSVRAQGTHFGAIYKIGQRRF